MGVSSLESLKFCMLELFLWDILLDIAKNLEQGH